MTRHQEIELCAFDEVDYTYTFTKEELEEFKKEYAQSIVLGKLPDSLIKDIAKGDAIAAIRMIELRSIALQPIRTEDEVTKPYKDFLRGLKSMQLPLYVHNQINLLLKTPIGEK